MGRSPESTGPGMRWGLGMQDGATPVTPTRMWPGTDQQDPGQRLRLRSLSLASRLQCLTQLPQTHFLTWKRGFKGK